MKKLKSALSFLLTLALLATSIVGAFPTFAAEDTATNTEEVKFDYEFDASGLNTDITQFDDDFYVFNPARAGTSTSSLTANKPTDEITSGTAGVFTRSGHPGVIINSLDGSHYGMMSYKTRKYTEFYAEYTTIDQAQIIGMAFGSPLGKAGIVNDSGDTAADNDQAVFITYRTGNFYIAGAVNTADVTFTNVTQSTSAHWLTSSMLGSNVAFVGGTATKYTTEITVCAEVQDGYLTAWIETEGVAADAQPTIKVKLTDAYEGGVVSLFHGSNSANGSGQLSYFSHFGVRDISDYDTDLSFVTNEYVDYLDQDFDVEQYKRHPDTVADANTFYTCEPSSKLGGYTVANTSSGYGGTNAGLRFNTNIGDGNTYSEGIFDVMSYKAHTYTNFYAEYDIVIGGNGVGLAFGLEGGNAGVSSDGNATNDRAVYIRMNNDGSFYAAGAVDTANGSVPGTTTSTSNLSQIVDAGNANIFSGDIGDAATTVTVIVKVLDGWMYLQYKGYDGIAKVKLTDAYVGGYIALYAAANYNATAFTGFRVKALQSEGWDYAFTVDNKGEGIAHLDDHFKVYSYYRKPSSASNARSYADPLSPADGASTSTTAGLKLNWTTSTTSNFGTLSYTDQKYTDFYAEYSVSNDDQVVGLAFGMALGNAGIINDGDETNDSAVYIRIRNDALTLAGAVDADNAENVVPNASATNVMSSVMDQVNFVSSADIVDADAATVCVQVKDGFVSAWKKDAPDTVMKVKLLDTYKGGIVSLHMANNGGPHFNSFAIRDLSEYDVDFSVVTNEDVTYLDRDFDVTQHKRHPDTVADANAFYTCEPSSQLGGYTVANTGSGYGGTNAGLRFNTNVGDGNTYSEGIFDVMLYKAHSYTDFYAEYDIVIGGNGVGLAFGLDGTNAGVSSDSDATNDRAVYIRMNNDGSFYAAGAVDTESVSVPGTTTSTSNLSQIVDAGKANIVSGDTGDAATTVTVIVKVLDGWMYLQYKGYEGIAKVKLTDAYIGGYVALYAAANYNATAFTGFRVKAIESAETNPGFTVLNPGEGVGYLDEDFRVYQFDRQPATKSASKALRNYDPSEEIVGVYYTMPAANTNTNYGSNNGIKISTQREQAIDSYGDVVGVMTYKKAQYTDFYAEYTATLGGQRVGLTFGADLGFAGVINDTDATNETAIWVNVKPDGVVLAAGAVDTTTLVATTPYTTSDWLTTSMLGSNIAVVGADLGADSSAITVCVEVKDGWLRVWREGDSEELKVKLSDAYRGGYISLWQGSDAASYFTGFEVRGTSIGNIEMTESTDNVYTFEVNAAEGKEVLAGSLLAMDKYGNQYVPTRVGFRSDMNSTVFEVKAPYVVHLDGRFIEPTAENPNMGNLGNSVNVQQKGLRFLSRVNRLIDGDTMTITLNGEKKVIKDYGMLLGLESVIGDNELTLEYKEGKSYIQQVSHLTKNTYYDYCDSYVDLSVCIVGLDKLTNGEDLSIVARTYVIYDDGTEDGAVLYADAFASTYADVLSVYNDSLDVVYLAADGHDARFGDTADAAVLTLDRAMELVKDGGTIEVVGTYTLDAFVESDKAVTFTGDTLDLTGQTNDAGTTGWVRLKAPTTFDAIDLKFTEGANLLAQGNALYITETSTVDNIINVFGGSQLAGSSYSSRFDTSVKLYAGTYNTIAGGNRCGLLHGDTYVEVGGTAGHNVGAGGHIYGGSGDDWGVIDGTTNVVVNGGNWEGVFGGNEFSSGADATNVTVNGGIIESIFGGNESSSMTPYAYSESGATASTVTITLNGGTVDRRVYGGSYNNLDASTATNYSVTGTVTVNINDGFTFSQAHSYWEGIRAGSRMESNATAEVATLVFENETVKSNFSGKYGTNDSLAASFAYDIADTTDTVSVKG